MSAADQWMPLHIGDYLADTAHLTVEQSGCYLHLLMSCWRVGYVPDDDTKLAAICRMSRQRWQAKIADAVRPFFDADDGRLTQGRLNREREKAAAISGKQRARRHAGWSKVHQEAGGHIDENPTKLEAVKPSENNNIADTAVIPTRGRLPLPLPREERKNIPSGCAEAGALMPDVRSLLWDEGLTIVRGLTGKPDGASRGIVGRLAKACRDDCAAALGISREARDLRPVGEPVAWLMAAARARDDPDARLMAAVGLTRATVIDDQANPDPWKSLQ